MKTLLLYVFLSVSACGQSTAPSPTATNESSTAQIVPVEALQSETPQAEVYDSPEALAWAKSTAKKHGLKAADIEALLAQTERNEGVLKKISRPAEKSKPWHEYRLIFADEARLQGGIDFYREHEALLNAAAQQYGVDPFIITAILGVETRYGKITGKTHVLSALATLCFDYPPRAAFFCDELAHFFRLSQREDWDASSIKGSYAGAMGMAQFMPSSYFNDARDGDGDGKIDLWRSPADAIFSIAHYLKKRGWQAHDTRYAKRFPNRGGLNHWGKGAKPYFVLSEINEALIHDADVIDWLNQNRQEKMGSLVFVEEMGESYWLTYHNFYVITRYNTSPMYAMAVVNLAENIRKNIMKP